MRLMFEFETMGNSNKSVSYQNKAMEKYLQSNPDKDYYISQLSSAILEITSSNRYNH